MRKCFAQVFLVWTLMILGLGLRAAPASALFPPAQAVSASIPPGSTTVEYSAQDPIGLQFRVEAWTLSQGDQRFVESLHVEKGIVTWIARYKNFSDTEYKYEIHYRIFDPGRGIWKGAFDTWMTGSARQVTQHQVRDGVVAFKASHKVGSDPVETFAVASTYDPASGAWVSWYKGYLDPVSPEVLSLRDGVLTYPLNPLGSPQHLAMTVYDRELRQWVEHNTSCRFIGSFDWLEIGDGTVHLRASDDSLWIPNTDIYFYYDPFAHLWNRTNDLWPNPIRRASFVVQPASGYAPMSVCYWDTSFAMNSPSGIWTYNFGDGMVSHNRSWVHKYWNAGTFPVSLGVSYGGQSYLAAGRTVTTQQYAPPTGGITINAGATYANSLNVTLQLNYSASAVQMCFMNLPGFMEWTPWESVVPSKSWQLSTFGVYDTPPDGLKTVKVKFRDGTGGESPVYEAAINLDLTPPATVLTLTYVADTTGDRNIRAEWSATDANGVEKMCYTSFDEGDLYLLWSPWTAYQQTTMTIPFSSKAGIKTVMVEFMDIAGNVSRVQHSIRQESLYFPHVATTFGWQTEIAIINIGDQTVEGALRAFSNEGQLIETKPVTLSGRGRMQITVGNEFTNHTTMGYIIFSTNSATVQGYAKFYQEGLFRTAIPAVKEVNASDIYISHIASDAQWWTGLSLVNTTASTKVLTITFNNGQSRPITLNANEHKAFNISSLFNNIPQPDILSAVITDASGIIGLELFGGSNQLDGLLLTDKTAWTLYYPHVASGEWWTGIVAYNPSASPCTITITPYSAEGTLLATLTPPPIPGSGRYIGAVAALGLPADTAWFRMDSTLPLSGFELFGTVDGQQLAPYAGGGGAGAKAGVLAKIEKLGWTGIAFVNTEDGTATITLTAYTDNGNVAANKVLSVGGHAKVVNLVEAIFLPQDTSNATYIAYSSDKNVVGFQVNGSADWTMLDGLPGL